MSVESQALDPLKLKLLVETAALRAMLINLYVEKFSGLPDPVAAARALQNTLALSPTKPPVCGNKADPALSDMIAGMTDEAIEAIMQAVVKRLECRVALS
jgi:hypothetical protein